MARITVTEERRGAMLEPGAGRRTHSAMLISIQRLMNKGWQFARIISPVLTGRYRSLHQYETHLTEYGAEGTMTNNDVAGKVRVIEYGFPPARPGLMGRAPRLVYTGTAEHLERLIRDEELSLTVELVRGLA